jgi:hypothetical protein
MKRLWWICGAIALVAGSVSGSSQPDRLPEVVRPGNLLDPSRVVQQVWMVGTFHAPLPEEYVWTAGDAAVTQDKQPLSELKRDDWKVQRHFFRKVFDLEKKPLKATLYVAGPRSAKVWVNGALVADLHCEGSHHMGFKVMNAEIDGALHSGQNLIAIEAVRGYGSHHHTNALKTAWLNSGEVLAVKIIAAEKGFDGPSLLLSDRAWKSTVSAATGWEQREFVDTTWPRVVSIGGIESTPDFFQWNADAGMFSWPGYLGESPYMANYRLNPVTSEQRKEGLLVDFGRELNGRVLLAAGSHALGAKVRCGESMGELLTAPYLGDVDIIAPAHAEARGPKSGFRYALVSFSEGSADAKVFAEGIYYPAAQVGSFTSSDVRLNKIWETAAYTAHLVMQDSILDGIKRDRGRWIGDDEAIDRVVADVYGDGRLVKAALEDAIGDAPVTQHVNGLPGYSAWWVVSEAEYIARWGDTDQLAVVKNRMLELLELMGRELDGRNVYAAVGGEKPFVDWADGLSSDSPEARRAVHFEYMLAFRRAAWLLHLAGDETDAAKYLARANSMAQAARTFLKDRSGAYGDRWQTNSIAVLAGAVETEAERQAVWGVLQRTVSGRKPSDVITPYYGSYLLMAMAELGHRGEALEWMRVYWGGMLDSGATSFWEAWDPGWAKGDVHAQLEADGKVGYNASLAHGWASGPSAWLMEEVLGVKTVEPGGRRVQIRPELAGLDWVRGALATPLGAVSVAARDKQVEIAIPAGMEAEVVLPVGHWMLNGAAVSMDQVEEGARVRTVLRKPGTFEFVRQ